ncbi:pitrilysin family protein [Roseisolibacter sp. H3M3-2]|uniref:M16 family metallopeptidase n=1 Tax=Roseisolibacter sp. H3M3-2 TaxID=3031323 RepID=UPI0023DAB0AD|nr:pitrilysin family protein [Roseisolibacter sp. H3M3-2]MDF1501544.1 pitrilysin family protein [Roseisolibacter sp. H3M3-2]
MTRRSRTRLAGLLAVPLVAGAPLPATLAAQQPAPAAEGPLPAKIPLERYQLPNGLTVILNEDHSAQVVTVDVWYDVGARNERPGRSGFAHLFEHMMFQGSSNVKKGEHFQLVERAGGSMNGSTQIDRTNYFQTLPSNRLNLGLWLEADRMRSLAVTPENLKNQQEAVKEERRLRFDNQPYIGTVLLSLAAAYDPKTCFAYGHELIGSMDDLNAAKVEDVQAFFKQYYAPNNATLVLTGDFQPAEAKRLITQYFGDIARVDAPPPVQCDQPFNPGEQRRRVTDAKATLPATFTVWRIPETKHADTPALQFLATILGQGESSRLNKAIAREAKAALGLQTFLNAVGPTRGPGTFGVLAIANQGVPADSLDRLIAREIARIAESGVTEAELAKAKNAYRASTINTAQTSLGRAEAIHHATMFLGDPEAVNTDIRRYLAVTAADVQRVAKAYLRPENGLFTLITPPEAPKP